MNKEQSKEQEFERTLNRLRESEIKYRTLFESATDGIFLMKGETILDCNQKFLAIFGCTNKSEVVGQTPYGFSPAVQADKRSSREKAIERGKAAIAGEPQFFEWKHCRLDGTLFDAEVSLNQIEIDKETRLLQAIVRDVTDRKEAENRLRISEEKYRSIFENTMEGIFQTTPDGRCLTANPALTRIHGYDSPKDLQEGFANIERDRYVDPQDRKKFKELLEKDGSLQGFEAQVYRKDRSTVWVSLNARTVRDENGQTLYYEGTLEDISRRKEMEDALRTSEERYRTFIDSTSDGVFLKDNSLRYVIVNRRLKEFLGKTEKEILGRTNFEIGWDDDGGSESRDLQALSSPSVLVTERKVRDRIYEIRRFAVRLRKNDAGVGGFVRDITDAKKAEEDLQSKSLNLQEVNAALRVLLKQREQDKEEMEERIYDNIRKLVMPYVERLKDRRLNEEQRNYLDILATNLNEIASPFLQKITSSYSHFTPTEILVADLIKDGKLIKEIAKICGVSDNAVNRHRQNIRNKLGLNRKKMNLRTYLMMLS